MNLRCRSDTKALAGGLTAPRARFLPPPSLPRLARDKVVDIFRPAAAEMLRVRGTVAGTSGDQPPHGTRGHVLALVTPDTGY